MQNHLRSLSLLLVQWQQLAHRFFHTENTHHILRGHAVLLQLPANLLRQRVYFRR